jgi:hypothetical protein
MKAAVGIALVLFMVALFGTTIAARLQTPASTPGGPAQSPSVVATGTPSPSATAQQGVRPPGTPTVPPALPAVTTTPALITPPPPEPTTAGAGLTYATVARHDAPPDCWIVVSNRVYDVTSYLIKHPGGAETIIPWCGRESTVAFQTEDGAGSHSPRAFRDLEMYLIGSLAPSP